MKKYLILFSIIMFSVSLYGDWGAPTFDGKPFVFNGKSYPTLPITSQFEPLSDYLSSSYSPVKGKWRLLVILVSYSDVTNQTFSTPDYFYDMFSGTGNKYRFKSMNDFYKENSIGKFSFSQIDVYGWIKLPKTRAYYSSDKYGFQELDNNMWTPKGALSLVNDAVTMATIKYGINLRDYDNDGDGRPESIIIIHTGPGAEVIKETENIWSHRSICSVKTTNYEGNIVYVIGPELFNNTETEPVRVGVFTHEYGHILNLPDLYDMDGSSCGAGPYSLMSHGVHTGYSPDKPKYPGSNPYPLDAWLKMKLGWVYPYDITINTCERKVYPVQTTGIIYRFSPASDSFEYFLVSFRKDYGFDHNMFAQYGDWKGAVYIWHVDERMGNGYLGLNYSYNNDECVPDTEDCRDKHFALSLEEADGQYYLETHNDACSIPSWYDLYHTGDLFTDTTIPSSRLWSGESSNFTVDIVNVTDDYAKVNFIVDPDFTLTPPQIISNPVVYAAIGKKYSYKPVATSYGLSYELLKKPVGMEIDNITGQITWIPNKTQIGDNSVIIRVVNCGGDDTQEFTIAVYDNSSQGCSCKTGTDGNLGDILPFIFLILLWWRKSEIYMD